MKSKCLFSYFVGEHVWTNDILLSNLLKDQTCVVFMMLFTDSDGRIIFFMCIFNAGLGG